MDFYTEITDLKGIGKKAKQYYEALDISHVGALLYHFPRTYQVYPEPVKELSDHVGEKVAVYVSLIRPISIKRTKNMDICIGTGVVGREKLELIWFRMPYIRTQIRQGMGYVFFGELKRTGTETCQLQQPVVFSVQEYRRMTQMPQPVYSLTKGLTNNAIKKAMAQLLTDSTLLREYLPAAIRKKRGLPDYGWAMKQIHIPDGFEELKEARYRLVYDEFMKFFLTKGLQGRDKEGCVNQWKCQKETFFLQALHMLPFSLTKGQEEALNEMKKDLNSDYVSQRLIQGDVGSGKTILAFLIMLLAVENGYQAGIMAPTEVLARQHEKTFLQYIKDFGLPFDVVCITGSVKAAERRRLNERVATEPGLFVIGTHALLSEGMVYHSLAVVVTDEQHRFGVRQRKALAGKGMDPHVIVMSATPIPRTLAMILYNDMHISVIKDVPKTKLPIKNAVITKEKRNQAFRFIAKELSAGHQAYVICPLVEASEKTEAENVMEYADYVRKCFGADISVAVLHGKLPQIQKDEIMQKFADGMVKILVSTTVVEVGINVPNATVIMIEDANRFGLAQLHQLRGRVGRGRWQSYCMFVDCSPGAKQSERLKVLESSNDGFFIANEDLRMRGPGDFFGIRQSGDLDFRIADIYRDTKVLQQASEDAGELLQQDPDLSGKEHTPVREYLRHMDTVVYTNL